jgi:hypothetical protein
MSSFVLRYRALWDKVLGLLVLLTAPRDYDRFASAKSRKKSFKRIVETSVPALQPIVGLLVELQRFDDHFRTAEAHGSGTLRKWTFSMHPLHQTPLVDLVGFWNLLNTLIGHLGTAFDLGPYVVQDAGAA